MTITPREMTLALGTLAAVLLGGTFFVMRPRYEAWQEMRAQQAALRREIDVDRALVEQRERWAQRFAELSAALPEHPAEQEMDVYWLKIVDAAARNHNVEIRRLQAGREAREGDVYELPVECLDWEGQLEALVRFLFELQSRGAMLDVRHLTVRPKAGRTLRGRFYLYCAYTRAEADPALTEEPATP